MEVHRTLKSDHTKSKQNSPLETPLIHNIKEKLTPERNRKDSITEYGRVCLYISIFNTAL